MSPSSLDFIFRVWVSKLPDVVKAALMAAAFTIDVATIAAACTKATPAATVVVIQSSNEPAPTPIYSDIRPRR